MPGLISDLTFAAIDFESAGERPKEAAIPIQIGIAEMRGLTLQPESFYRSYLRAEQPVTWVAQQIHGICSDDLKDAPTLLSLWPEVKNRLSGRWIVAHGSGAEKRFLRAFPLHGFGPWVDTLTLSRKILPHHSSYSLSDLVRELGLEEEAMSLLTDFRWHEALSDAIASLLLLKKLVQVAEIQHQRAKILLSD